MGGRRTELEGLEKREGLEDVEALEEIDAGSSSTRTEQIMAWLEEVSDPEIPVLNVVEMGIVRRVEAHGDRWHVVITPTYSGCPAMNAIEQAVRIKMMEKEVLNADVVVDHREPWTTDWMTDEARQKLRAYGIAPPPPTGHDDSFLTSLRGAQSVVPCPFCDALDTELRSEFGSTACKSLYYCHECHQPFEHFKCI